MDAITTTALTPVSAATGGVLIGLAVVLLLAVNGRVAGISGNAGGLLRAGSGDAGVPVIVDASLPLVILG